MRSFPRQSLILQAVISVFNLILMIPIISPIVYLVKNTENPSMVWVDKENVPKQGPSEIDTVTNIFPTGHQNCIPKQRVEYNYDGNSDDFTESDC